MKNMSSFEEFHSFQRLQRAKSEMEAHNESIDFRNEDSMVAEQVPFLDNRNGQQPQSGKGSELKSQKKEENEASLNYSRVVKSMGRIAESDKV